MPNLIQNVEFWKALISLAWPAVALVVFFLVRDKLVGLFARDNLTIKVAGMEISVADAAKNLGTQVADLQKKVAEIESSQVATNKNGAVIANDDLYGGNTRPSRLGTEDDKFSILWVDDFPINNAFIVEQLRSEGIFVQLSLSTKEGLSELDNRNYSIVISDLGRNEDGIEKRFAGLELAAAIRKRDKDVPILIFAGLRGIENKAKLLEAGANGVTSSPVEVQAFVMKHYKRSGQAELPK